VNRELDFLLSVIYDAHRLDHPAHLADLRKSGLSDETIRRQKVSDVPPDMIDRLLGFPAPKVVSAYVIPFPDPRGGWLDHVRMKVFPSIETERGLVKYLQPRKSGVRIYFPLATLDAVLHSTETLWICEGEKKALALAQTGEPTVGICGIEGWHIGGSRDLHPDLDDVGLTGRLVKVIPDGDYRTNPAVHAAVQGLGRALAARGATPRVVYVPDGYKGVDDWLVSQS
jgi:hypothetical protein